MIKKSIFVVLAMFGLNSVAEVNAGSEMDHMSDMIQSGSGEMESNFNGAVELKYKALGAIEEGKEGPSYRVRLGWRGDVNEEIKWGVGFSSGIEERFKGPNLANVHLEQAYVSYTPVEGFSIRAGKYAWRSKFHKTGVLYDDDLYPEGVSVKYHQGDDDGRFYIKAALHEWDADFSGPFAEGAVLKGKIGGKYALSSDMKGGVYVSAEYDGLFKGEDVTPKTLAKVGVSLSDSSMVFPAGVFGVYVTDLEDLTANHSFTGGVYVGNAGTPTSGEVGDFGVAVSYYDTNENDFNSKLVDTDYVSGAGRGIAVRAQYNLWDSANVVAKYAHNLAGGEDANNLVGELTFNF